MVDAAGLNPVALLGSLVLPVLTEKNHFPKLFFTAPLINT